MKIEQTCWTPKNGWSPKPPGSLKIEVQWVMIFGNSILLRNEKLLKEIRKIYPNAFLWGCSTAGEICGTQVMDDSLVVTAVSFSHTKVKGVKVNINQMNSSYDAGVQLAGQLEKNGLAHILILSDGLKINGSELVRGLSDELPDEVKITGGLSGDGERFQETTVLLDEKPEKGSIVAIGIYGNRIHIGYGSLGGWDPFGPERIITRSKGNVLYEMDGKSALELYKRYLGEHAQGLPATGLLFPLMLRLKDEEEGVVRTILSIDEKTESMTFAGDVPERAYARLMKANHDRLIDGAVGAAKTAKQNLKQKLPNLALLISCVGRKMVLKQRVEEEIEGVQEVLGNQTVLTGFYSYGEICPFSPEAKCRLHNQTMTITTFYES